jgi:SAM-dependent methyltransferase
MEQQPPMRLTAPHVFRSVDASGVQPMLIDYLARVGQRPDIRRMDDAALRLLQLAPGQRVLEVGCGVGDDAAELAGLVGPTGSVVAIDVSEDMLAAARGRHADVPGLSFEPGDAMALRYDDESFDAVRSERVVQHVADAGVAIREMARVLRPGGRLAVLETDWRSIAVDLDLDLVLALEAHGEERMPGFRVGRTVRRLMIEAGLTDVRTEAFAFTFTSLADAGEVLPVFNENIPPEAEMFPAGVRERWYAAAHAADEAGTLFAGYTAYLVVGVRA